MSARSITLAALGCVAIIALLFAFIPRPAPNPAQSVTTQLAPAGQPASMDPIVQITSHAGPSALGSIDSVHSGAVVIIVARGHSEHGRSSLVSREPMTIFGWVVSDGKALGKSVIYRIDDGSPYQAQYAQRRPDVGIALKDPALEPSGFVAHVPVTSLASGHHTISFSLDTGSLLESFDNPVQIDVR